MAMLHTQKSQQEDDRDRIIRVASTQGLPYYNPYDGRSFTTKNYCGLATVPFLIVPVVTHFKISKSPIEARRHPLYEVRQTPIDESAIVHKATRGNGTGHSDPNYMPRLHGNRGQRMIGHVSSHDINVSSRRLVSTIHPTTMRHTSFSGSESMISGTILTSRVAMIEYTTRVI